MAVLIQTFRDGSKLEYDKGKFDLSCIYYTKAGVKRRALKDVEYFAVLKSLGAKYGNDRVYDDFVKIFSLTGKRLEQVVLQQIVSLSSEYGTDALEFEKVFTTLYAGMVAEERKAKTRLGKRIKRLGVHQVLKESMSPEAAARFSRGKHVPELKQLMTQKGF